MTHGYERNGTTDQFATLNIGTGESIHQTGNNHEGTDVLAFFEWVGLDTPQNLKIQVVLESCSPASDPELVIDGESYRHRQKPQVQPAS